MSRTSTAWEVVQSDILIIGGGFGGLWSALRAAQCGSSVTLVDKSFAGKSGHSYFATGGMMVLLPGDDLDEYVCDIVYGNDWIIEQDMVTAIFEGSYRRLKDVESFGINFQKSGGEYIRPTKARGTKSIRTVRLENATAADVVTSLRKVAIHRGVKFVNHVYVYDLVNHNDNSIVGAIGIGVKEPHNYLFKARSVVIATNTGSYRGHHLACELQGTGPFMAYDAGAKLKNPEFHYINMRPVKHELEGSGVFPSMGGKWMNAKGIHFMKGYDPESKDRASNMKITVSAAKEAMKGNAPIFMDVQGMTEEEREKFRLLLVSHGWQPILYEKCRREEGYDILRDNIEWQPAYEVNKLGICTDINGKTSLNGLFAAGMARSLGINPFGGWSIAACTWAGYTAGESASMYARNADFKEIDLADLSERKRKFFEPLQRQSGIEPDDLIHDLQKILFPADVLIIMSEPKLKNALDKVIRLKEGQMPNLKATDTRTLIKSEEAQTMVFSAEMTLRASLMRKETRPNIFYREDFNSVDNKNWLKWITVEKGGNGEIKFSTEDIPLDKYRFKPET